MLTLNQFLFQHGLHLVIDPRDGSDYVCLELRDGSDFLAEFVDATVQVFGPHEEVWDKLTQALSNKYISWGWPHNCEIKVPELRV